MNMACHIPTEPVLLRAALKASTAWSGVKAASGLAMICSTQSAKEKSELTTLDSAAEGAAPTARLTANKATVVRVARTMVPGCTGLRVDWRCVYGCYLFARDVPILYSFGQAITVDLVGDVGNSKSFEWGPCSFLPTNKRATHRIAARK